MKAMRYFSQFVSEAMRERLCDQIRIEAVHDAQTLTLKDGSLLSMISLGGAYRAPGDAEIDQMVEQLRIALSPYLALPGHLLEVSFLRDPQAATRHVERLCGRLEAHARRSGLVFEDILEERAQVLSKQMTDEVCLIGIYSRPVILSREETEEEAKLVTRRTAMIPPMIRAQTPYKVMPTVAVRHDSLVSGLARVLTLNGQSCTVLGVTDLLRECRAGLNPDLAAEKDDWSPRIPGMIAEPGRGRRKSRLVMAPDQPAEVSFLDFSEIGTPTLDLQVATEDAFVENSRTVRIGATIFQAFDMTLAPEVLPDFNALVDDISAKAPTMPWRAVMRIESGGVHSQLLKKVYLSIFRWAAPTWNRRIQEAILLNEQIDGKDDVIVRFRMSFATWAPAEQSSLLRQRAQTLAGAVKRWGNSGVDSLSGDPMATVLATCPGITTFATAPVAAGPLYDTLAMMPIAREVSPWSTGSTLFRSSSGRPWPFKIGSSLQTTWINLAVGTPGSGKSVLLNALNFGAVLTPNAAGNGTPVLPMIGIIDIGKSSQGVVSLIREALPANRRHEVVSHRLKMSVDNAVNIFDTPLGMRRPMPSDRQFLINFLTLVCSDAEGRLNPAMSGLIGAAIDRAYEDFGDGRFPKRYIRDDLPIVDRALDELGFPDPEVASWWDVVDFLAAKGSLHLAELAQRHAVPVLSDLVSASQSDQVQSLYGSAIDRDTNQPILVSFQRMISEVVRDYAILSGHTRFSLRGARIVALDLMDVTAKGAGATALRQTAMMYMLARNILARDYFLNADEIRLMHQRGDLPAGYLEHHLVRARDMLQIPKILCMDEFHRTGGIPAIIDQVLLDGREGRKFNIVLTILSQLISDFPRTLLELASTIFVCNAGSEGSIRDLDETYALTTRDKTILRSELTGPSKRGTPIWVLAKIRDGGQVRQKVYLTLGPSELWAFSTTAEDVALRSRLYDELGPVLARKLLARRFPTGSAKAEIEARIARFEDSGERLDEGQRYGVIEALARDLRQMSMSDT